MQTHQSQKVSASLNKSQQVKGNRFSFSILYYIFALYFSFAYVVRGILLDIRECGTVLFRVFMKNVLDFRSVVLLCSAFGMSHVAHAQAQAQSSTAISKTVPFLPHKAVYNLSLLKSTGARSVESARGKIVFEFAGDACEGYTLNFRQVTELTSGESGSRMSDLRSTTFEEGAGQSFHVKSDSLINGKSDKKIEGVAERRNNAIEVKLSKPKKDKQSLSGDVLFPTEHLKQIIMAAKEEKTTFGVQVYDGSEDGFKVYDTLSIIGKMSKAGKNESLEKANINKALEGVARWPVSISYFEKGEGERTPIYVLSFDLYENGVSGNLKLDYGDFALKGEMTLLDALPISTSCQK